MNTNDPKGSQQRQEETPERRLEAGGPAGKMPALRRDWRVPGGPIDDALR